MELSPDQTIFWQYNFIKINETILTTWFLIFFLIVGAKLISYNSLKSIERTRWQNFLEMIVTKIETLIEEVGLPKPRNYLSFIGTLFLFIALSSLFTIIPGYTAPTGSLSTTTALAIAVFIAVPYYGIKEKSLLQYLKSYAQPTIFMLPFNIISEASRTLALAVRLFGNMMSGAMILGILLSVTPLLFPIIMTLLGLLTGMVQAYIFTILAVVYIAAATRTQNIKQPQRENYG